jgi:hypothetical protein
VFNSGAGDVIVLNGSVLIGGKTNSVNVAPGGLLAVNGNITVAGTASLPSGAALDLGGGLLTIDGGDFEPAGVINSGGGGIIVNIGAFNQQPSGALAGVGINITASGGIEAAAPANSIGGSVSLADMYGGAVNFVTNSPGGLSLNGVSAANGAVSITNSGGALTQSAPLSGSYLTVKALGPVTLTNGGNAAGVLDVRGAGGPVRYTGSGGFTVAFLAANGVDVTLKALTGNVTIGSPVAGPASLSIDSPAEIGADITTGGDQVYAGAVTLNAAAALSAAGSITFHDAVDGAEALTLNAGAGAVIFGGAVGSAAPPRLLAIDGGQAAAAGTVSAGTLTIASGAALDMGAAPLLLAAGLRADGTLTLGGGNAVIGGTVSIGGTLNAGSGVIETAGNWENGGVFNHGGGSVVFTGTGDTVVSGGNSFNNVTAYGKTLRLASSGTQSVSGRITLAGGTLTSGSAPARFILDVPASAANVDITNTYIEHGNSVNSLTGITGIAAAGNATSLYRTTRNFFLLDPYQWAGSSPDWADTNNWVENERPALNDGTENVLIGTASAHPILTSGVSLKNLTIAAGAIMDLNGRSLALSGTYSNAGTLALLGGETVTAGFGIAGTAAGGLTRYTGAGGGSLSSLTDFYHLEIAEGNRSLGDDITVYGGFRTAAALAAKSLTVAGPSSVGAAITTSGSQSYGGGVTLTADAALMSVSGSLVFGGDVTGSAPGSRDLSLEAGAVIADGVLGGTNYFKTLTIAGSTAVYTPVKNLEVSALTLTLLPGSALGSSAGKNIVVKAGSFGAQPGGSGGALNAGLGSVYISHVSPGKSIGLADLRGDLYIPASLFNRIIAASAQIGDDDTTEIYAGSLSAIRPVNLYDMTLKNGLSGGTSHNLDFNFNGSSDTLDIGGKTLTISVSGAVTSSAGSPPSAADVTAGTLVVSRASAVGASGAPLKTSVLSAGKSPASGLISEMHLKEMDDLVISGQLNAGALSIQAGGGITQSGAGAVIAGAALLETSGTGWITLDNPANAAGTLLLVTESGAASFTNSANLTSAAKSAGGAVTVTSAGGTVTVGQVSDAAGSIVSGITSGGGNVTLTAPLVKLDTDVSSAPAGGGGNGGDVWFSGAVSLGGDGGSRTVTTGASGLGGVSFTGSAGGSRSLIVEAGGGSINFSGAGGGEPLASLTASASGGISISANVKTSGDQNYNGPVSLTNALTLETASPSAITFHSALSASQPAAVKGAGTFTLSGGLSAPLLKFAGASLPAGTEIFFDPGAGALNASVQIETGVILINHDAIQSAGKNINLNSGRLDLRAKSWRQGVLAGGGFHGENGRLDADVDDAELISGGDVVIKSGNIRKLSIVMTGGGSLSRSLINIHPSGSFANFTLEGSNSSGYVEAASDLTVGGSWTVPSWTADRPNPPRPLAERVANEARFFPGNFTVLFTGSAALIRGNTFWHNITSVTPAAKLYFSNYPDIHTTLENGLMTFTGGNLSNRITLNPWKPQTSGYTPSAVTASWNDVVTSAKDFFWVLSRNGAASVNYLTVNNNFALPNVSINTAQVDASWATNRSVNWTAAARFLYTFTEDSDGNGRLDRLRIQAPSKLWWNPAKSAGDFVIALPPGYEIDRNDQSDGRSGYKITGGAADMIYIFLKERDEPDTGELPVWNIPEDGNNDVLLTKDDLNNDTPVSVVDDMSTVDTAPPRIFYALAISGRDEAYIRFSEPVEDRKIQAIVGGLFAAGYTVKSVTPLDPQTVNTAGYGGSLVYAGEFKIKVDKPFQADDIANGITFNESLFKDVRDAPPIPYNWPSPGIIVKYPEDYDYGQYHPLGLSGPGLPQPLENETGGRVSQPNFFRMGISGAADLAIKHRVSDLMLMARPESAEDAFLSLWPLYVHDTGGDEGIKRGVAQRYDGSETIRNTDLTIETIANAGISFDSPPEILFGLNKGAENDRLWLPPSAGGTSYPPYYLNIKREVAPAPGFLEKILPESAGKRYFFNIVRRNLSENGRGSSFEFIFTVPRPSKSPVLGPLYAVRYKGPPSSGDWYRSANFANFIVKLRDIVIQRSGVTILSNVINPAIGEKTILNYRLTRGGQVTAQVFTLDGNLVKTLYRGARTPGEYDAVWDGKNSGGGIVARGMYFIRIVAPDIDEIRKVMVVK